jgi:hypothetical protein
MSVEPFWKPIPSPQVHWALQWCPLHSAHEVIGQRDIVEIDGMEVERKPGKDNDLVASTVTVLWPVIIRKVGKGFTNSEQALEMVEDTIEMFPIGAFMTDLTDDSLVYAE